MAIKQIVQAPNTVLTKKTNIVKVFDGGLAKVVGDLIDTLNTAKDPEGAGISANQIGSTQRICVVKNLESESPNATYILVNPKIISKSAEINADWEGCLSVPNVYGMVARHNKIKVAAQDIEGQSIRLKAAGFFARVIQHEIDHLDGILFTSKVTGKTVSEEELNKLLKPLETAHGRPTTASKASRWRRPHGRLIS